MSVSDNRGKSQFEITSDGVVAGKAEYRRGKGEIAILHTEVGDAFEGKGLGSELVRGVLDQARADALAVLPFCEFTRDYIAEHPEYLDLVPEDRRSEFDL